MEERGQGLSRKALRKRVKKHHQLRRIDTEANEEMQELHDALFVGDVLMNATEERLLSRTLLAWLDSLTDVAA